MDESEPDEQGAARFEVASADGTPIAVSVDGSGPPIALVHGSFGDHTSWAIPVEVLREEFTTFAMDRRGFGASGDGDEYTIERDFEDVAAVVDAVAARTRAPVALWGHSYGANCAMGGANLTGNVHRLVLYEPSLGLAYPPGAVAAAEAALAAGDREAAVIRILGDALEMTDAEISDLRASPRWPNVLAGAHAAPRECRVEEGWVYTPGVFANITAPTLMLLGTASPASVARATHDAAAAISDVRVQRLEGHGHFAHRTDPEMVVAIVREFCAS